MGNRKIYIEEIAGDNPRVLINDVILSYGATTPIDTLNGTDVVDKDNLLEAIANATGIEVSIPKGSPRPFIIDMTDPIYQNVSLNVKPQVSLLTNGDYDTATKRRIVYDVPVEIEYADDSRSMLLEIQVTGYEDFGDPSGLTTDFDLILIL